MLHVGMILSQRGLVGLCVLRANERVWRAFAIGLVIDVAFVIRNRRLQMIPRGLHDAESMDAFGGIGEKPVQLLAVGALACRRRGSAVVVRFARHLGGQGFIRFTHFRDPLRQYGAWLPGVFAKPGFHVG